MTKESAVRKPSFLSNVSHQDSAQRANFAVAAPPHVRPAVEPPAPKPQPAAQHAPPPAPQIQIIDPRPEMLARLQVAIDKLRHEGERLAEAARADTLEIAFHIARRILEQELRSSPDALFALVRTAVRRAGEVRRVLIRVHPGDVAALEGEAGKKALQQITVARVDIVGDATLSPGDVIVESAEARVDGRIDSRLSELKRAVSDS
jgi:flagellar assembly protein FliH